MVTDRMIDQNYYNYEQYEQSQPIEVFCSLVSLRLLFMKKYLHEVVWKMNVYIIKHCLYLRIYSLSVKKNDGILRVTNGNIITFSLHFFFWYLSIFLFSYRYFWYPKLLIRIDIYRQYSHCWHTCFDFICTYWYMCGSLRHKIPLNFRMYQWGKGRNKETICEFLNFIKCKCRRWERVSLIILSAELQWRWQPYLFS